MERIPAAHTQADREMLRGEESTSKLGPTFDKVSAAHQKVSHEEQMLDRLEQDFTRASDQLERVRDFRFKAKECVADSHILLKAALLELAQEHYPVAQERPQTIGDALGMQWAGPTTADGKPEIFRLVDGEGIKVNLEEGETAPYLVKVDYTGLRVMGDPRSDFEKRVISDEPLGKQEMPEMRPPFDNILIAVGAEDAGEWLENVGLEKRDVFVVTSPETLRMARFPSDTPVRWTKAAYESAERSEIAKQGILEALRGSCVLTPAGKGWQDGETDDIPAPEPTLLTFDDDMGKLREATPAERRALLNAMGLRMPETEVAAAPDPDEGEAEKRDDGEKHDVVTGKVLSWLSKLSASTEMLAEQIQKAAAERKDQTS